MPSLRQIISDHAPVLLLDACSTLVQVGWFSGSDEVRWASSTAEAGRGVFQCVEELGISPDQAAAFVFCDGPGSILGIRTVAMAVRTWQVLNPRPIYRFHSLQLVAHALGRTDLTIIADARRDTWHCLRIGAPLTRVPTAELQGALATLDEFRHWTMLPAHVERIPYRIAHLLPRIGDVDLFQPTDAPDAFLHEEPSYVTWTPRIHRAP